VNLLFLRTIFVFVFMFFLQTSTSVWPSLSAQTKTAQELLQHEVIVTLKLVQVYVVDPEGNPARDLEKSDFVLYDNGKLQNITDFEKHFLYVPEVKPVESKLPQARDVSSVMNRKFIFLIDYQNNDLEGVAKSRNAALEFIDTKAQPGDEIALLSYSRIRRLILHEYLTSDHQKVREAIKKIRVVPGIKGGWDSWAALGHSVMGMEADVPSESTTSAEIRGTTLRFTSSLRELAKALRHIPGQKNVVLFSRGYGVSVLMHSSPISRAFLEMGRELASANCPVFSVNTITGMGKRKVLPEDSLDYLSRLTGGKYYPDVNYYSKIAEDIQNTTSSYYVLGYPIESTWDGKFHDIKVEVKRAKYKVYAQRGYFNPLPFNQLSPVEKHLHLLDLALGEKAYFEQHLNFPLTALPFSDKEESNTILISEIPVQTIRESIGDNTEFISLIFDQDRTIVDSKKMVIDWETDGREKLFQYSTAALAPGRYDCRVIIRNLDNGKAAVGACAIEILEKSAAELKVYPPLLLIAGSEAQYLNISAQSEDKAGNDVSLSQVFPFPAKQFIPFTGELKQGTLSLYAVLRAEWSGALEPEIQIVAWLVPEGKDEKMPATFSILSGVSQGEADILFLEFDIPELRPGQYSLHILAGDSVTKASCATKSDFWVR
jgi:VWFA-related protein